MIESSKAGIIDLICQALSLGDRTTASTLARERYGHTPCVNVGRRYTEYQLAQVFIRDGYVDRYSGQRLVFPGTLRLLSVLMPEEFPAHPNWKMSESHLVYYELFPTLDHVVPVARRGLDEQTNWITTSMLRNSAKANWTLEELGWPLLPPGKIQDWDGLMRWFVAYTDSNPTVLSNAYLKGWRAAALRVMAEQSGGIGRHSDAGEEPDEHEQPAGRITCK